MTAVGFPVHTSDARMPWRQLLPTMLALKVTLLRNGVIGSRRRVYFAVATYVFTFVGSVASAWRIVTHAHGSNADSLQELTVTLSVLFGLWVFGPLLVGGVDDALDPMKLQLLPLQRSELRAGLAVGAVVGPVPIATLITLSGVVIGYWPGDWIRGSVTIIAVLVVFALDLAMSRALSIVLAFSGRSRRGKDIAVVVAAFGAAALFLGTQSLRYLDEAMEQRVIGALRWLPSGQLALAVTSLRHGLSPATALRIVGAAALSTFCFWVWLAGTDRLATDPDAIRHARRASTTDVHAIVPRLLRRWSGNRLVMLAAKELRYLARSPHRRSSLIISVVIGTVFALLQSLRYAHSNPSVVFGAFVATLFGVHATNNVLGSDASSLWIEQTAGARLREQLVARSVAAAPNLIIPTLLAAFVLAVLSHGWSQFAIVVVCCFVLLGIPLGIGIPISVIAPFSQPDVANPYSNRRVTAGQGGLVSLFAVIGVVSQGVVALPAIALIGIGVLTGNLAVLAVAFVLSGAYSYGVFRAGLHLAMRHVAGRETDVLDSIGGRRSQV